MLPEPITDHAVQGLDLLLSVWKERPNFVAFCNTYLKQIQDLEDAIWTCIDRQGLESIRSGKPPADGVALDAIGRIVGEPRNEKTDEEYIPFIRAKVKANNSDGHVPQLIEILNLLLSIPQAGVIQISNFGYMEAEIFIDQILTDSERTAVLRFMLLAVDATLNTEIKFTFSDTEDTFSLSSTYDTDEMDPLSGMGSDYDTIGGEFTHTRIL